MWGNCGKMPGRTDVQTQDSGRATAPPGVLYPGYNSVGSNNSAVPTKYSQYSPCFGISQSNASSQVQSPKYTPNYANVPFLTPKAPEEAKKSVKSTKDDTELGYNFSELQQFLAKQKPDSVAECLLNYLQKKEEDHSNGSQKKCKKPVNTTMNQFHHHHHDERKRSGYSDYSLQWEFQQELGSHRRSFCSQSAPWGPMSAAIGMPGMAGMSSIAGLPGPHQSNPYYSNPHVMPAHAHSSSDYRYAQWNSGKLQNAHSSQPSLKPSHMDTPSSGKTPLTELQALIAPENTNKSSESPKNSAMNYEVETVDLSCQQPVSLTVDRDKEITSTNNEDKEPECSKMEIAEEKKEEKEKEPSPKIEEELKEEKAGDKPKEEEFQVAEPESSLNLPEVKLPENVEKPETEPQPTVSSTSVDVEKPIVREIGKKKAGKGKNKKARSKGKKAVKKVVKVVTKKVPLETRKGPYLHIRGTRENPISVVVVNCPKGEDDEDKEKKPGAVSRTKSHHHIDLKRRGRSDLFSSTLSSRYDAARPDVTWVCIFCKQGSHRSGLGDLFGPYSISKEETGEDVEGGEEEEEQAIAEMQIRGGRHKRSLRGSGLLEGYRWLSKKLRKSSQCDPEEALVGLLPTEQADQFEVWTHEMCAIWSSSVYLLDSKLMGLQEAVWLSHSTICSKCAKPGANLSCIHRNCPNRSHFPCAESSGWSLPLETFIATCPIHAKTS